MLNMICLRSFLWPARALSLVLTGAVLSGTALAEPESTDAVVRMMQEKGFLDPMGSGASSSATTTSPAPTERPIVSPAVPAKPEPSTTAPWVPPSRPSFAQQVRDSASEMVLSAMNLLGVRYRRGGTSAEDGFDCSGFTRHVFEHSLGLVLPRRADEQANAPGLLKVQRGELQPGDLVFFNTLRRTFSHVGIYIGEGKFIHAPRTGAQVRVEDMRFSYWAKRYTGARRPDTATPVAALGPRFNGIASPPNALLPLSSPSVTLDIAPRIDPSLHYN